MEQIEEYKQIVMGRFMSLSDEEKSVLGSLPGTAVGDALGKLFGPEMGDLIATDDEGSDTQAAPMASQMKRAGLGAR